MAPRCRAPGSVLAVLLAAAVAMGALPPASRAARPPGDVTAGRAPVGQAAEQISASTTASRAQQWAERSPSAISNAAAAAAPLRRLHGPYRSLRAHYKVGVPVPPPDKLPVDGSSSDSGDAADDGVLQQADHMVASAPGDGGGAAAQHQQQRRLLQQPPNIDFSQPPPSLNATCAVPVQVRCLLALPSSPPAAASYSCQPARNQPPPLNQTLAFLNALSCALCPWWLAASGADAALPQPGRRRLGHLHQLAGQRQLRGQVAGDQPVGAAAAALLLVRRAVLRGPRLPAAGQPLSVRLPNDRRRHLGAPAAQQAGE